MRYVLKLAYNGSGYSGFQRQSQDKTVQGELEKALSRIFAHPIEIAGAGRTDTGVHALGQVVAFESETRRPLPGLIKGVNGMLAPNAALLEAVVLPQDTDFHPRFSALCRTYEYHILASCGQSDLVLNSQGRWCVAEDLDLALMQEACPVFVGEHDFETFTARCDMPHFRREVKELSVEHLGASHQSEGTSYKITITANGFLRRMVRLIAAAIVETGMKRRLPDDLQEMLLARDSGRAPHPAPPQGLYFTSVGYEPDPFALGRDKGEHFRASAPQYHRFKS